jgi:glycosyltransferase involved in cell wall biosynthesis
MKKVSIILPAKNEEATIGGIIEALTDLYPEYEIIVVDDGSTDSTAQIAEDSGAHVIKHPYNKGNGAAIKTGARTASGDILVFMDADGQHNPEDVARLLERLDQGYDMVVGARSRHFQSGKRRLVGNVFYNKIASWIVGHKIEDLTSGMRVVKAETFNSMLYLLPNGFSYPTTTTMAYFRAGLSVSYLRLKLLGTRKNSHISIVKDGLRFLLIIFKIGSLYSPLKIFFPFAMIHLLLGLMYYGYTFIAYGRFTNMSLLLIVSSIVIFLIGLISEQITMLLYKSRG